jgi:hypothetical protein
VVRVLEFAKTQRKLGGSGSGYVWALAWRPCCLKTYQKHTGNLVGGALGLIGFWLVVGLLDAVCPNRQGEDVCFSRWFVFWNLQKNTTEN